MGLFQEMKQFNEERERHNPFKDLNVAPQYSPPFLTVLEKKGRFLADTKTVNKELFKWCEENKYFIKISGDKYLIEKIKE